MAYRIWKVMREAGFEMRDARSKKQEARSKEGPYLATGISTLEIGPAFLLQLNRKSSNRVERKIDHQLSAFLS